jgi:hypothetical protein
MSLQNGAVVPWTLGLKNGAVVPLTLSLMNGAVMPLTLQPDEWRSCALDFAA